MKFKIIAVLVLVATLTSCGAFNRQVSRFTGNAVEVCHKGVVYLQFTSGSTVAYDAKTKTIMTGC